MGCSSEQVRKVTGKELNGWRSIPGNTIVLWPLRNRCDIHSASCPVTLRLKQSEREIGVRSPSDEKYYSTYRMALCLGTGPTVHFFLAENARHSGLGRYAAYPFGDKTS